MQSMGFPCGSVVKNRPVRQGHGRHRLNPWVRKTPLEEEMAAHSSMLAGKFHGRWNLVGCSPRGHEELDPTDVT